MILFTVIQLMTSNTTHAKSTMPTISLESYDEEEFYLDLDGEWLFFEEELLLHTDLTEQMMKKGQVLQVPTDFASHMGRENSYGTYIVNVRLPEGLIGKSIAVYVPYQYSAYNLFIDEKLVARNGRVGIDSATHEAEMAPKTANFTPSNSEIQIVMQVSSFEHIRGGFENSIFIGESSVVDQKTNSQMISGSFINGFVFIIGMFMVLFALYRRRDILFLIFGLFALSVSLRSFFTVPFHYTILFPSMSWLWGTRIEYVLSISASMFYVMLMWRWHKSEFSKYVMYFLVGVHLFVLIPTFFTQPVFFQSLYFKVFYLAIPTFIYFVYVVIKSVRNNNVSAKVNLLGIAIIFIAFLNDFFIGQGWYQSWNLMLPAVALYIIIHVVSMSRQFALSVFQIEGQNVQLKQLNELNEKLTAKLQQEIKRKDEFLANTSHELRNPLHGMINIAHSILINKPDMLDEEMQEEINLQVTIGHHMARTLDDLLDVTRLKEQQIKLQKSKFHISSVAKAVIDMLDVLVERKDVAIELEIDEQLPPIVADQNRLIQILFNLLHNALKFTYEGKVIIRACETDGFLKVEIEDTGIGMEPELIERLFAPYEQGNSRLIMDSGGLGLGLSISKELVELHGGEISAVSTKNEGSTFTFTLPFTDEESSEQEIEKDIIRLDRESIKASISTSLQKVAATITEDRYSVEKSNILIVDDDAVNSRVIRNVLSNTNYNIEVSTSGEEALAKLNESDYHLLILDVMMPTMSGYELTRKIRKSHSISELPIILLTARNNPDDIYTGFLSGANDYLIKPVDAMELIVRVDALTNLQVSIKKRLRMEAAWLHAQIRPHFLLNTLNSIISLSKIDTERMMKLIEEFANYLHSSFQFKNLDKVILLEEEIKLLKSYLYIQTERFGERLQVEWDIAKLVDVAIPPLALQTLVENAVNHGVLQKDEGGTVTIGVRNVSNGIELSVIDDGVGMDEETVNNLLIAHPDHKRGIGLINTEQRLQRLFGTGLQIKSKLGEGSKFSFVVPENGLNKN